MSNWDVTFRSQQLAKQQELGYAGIEADANARSAGMLAQGGQQIGGMIQHQRQFEAAQAQQDAHFRLQQEQQAQQFMEQVEVERQDAASRLALRQAQMQESQLKIQSMLELDRLGMSKQQVRALEIQNNAAAYALEQQKKQDANRDKDKNLEFMREFTSRLDPGQAAIMGLKFDPSSPTGYGTFANKEEQNAAIESFARLKHRPASTPATRGEIGRAHV